jgi:hypothetical protein
MRTLSGIGVPPTTGPAQKKKKKKKKNPQQPPPTNCELKESHRMDYTRRVWALRLLVAGLWRAAQKAVASGLKEGRLDLATATGEAGMVRSKGFVLCRLGQSAWLEALLLFSMQLCGS